LSNNESTTSETAFSITNYAYWNTIRESIFEVVDEQLIQIAIERGLKPHRQKLIRDNYGYFQNFMKQKIRYMLTELLKTSEVKTKLRSIGQESKKEEEQIAGLTKVLVDEIMLSDKNKQRILDYISEFITFLIVF
jgi:hypothetical protein